MPIAVNGRPRPGELAPIPGGQLSKAEAARWNTMCFIARARDGTHPMPNGPLSSIRLISGQVLLRREWCARGACQNAAVPGTSNHGWGRAVDTGQLQQAYRHGSTCGIRPPSDAPWESWHALVRIEGHIRGVPSGPRVLRKGVRPGDDVTELQKLLRQAGYWPARRKVGRTYGAYTRRRVRAFQRAHHLTADGIVGPKTLRAIKRAAKAHHRRHR